MDVNWIAPVVLGCHLICLLHIEWQRKRGGFDTPFQLPDGRTLLRLPATFEVARLAFVVAGVGFFMLTAPADAFLLWSLAIATTLIVGLAVWHASLRITVSGDTLTVSRCGFAIRRLALAEVTEIRRLNWFHGRWIVLSLKGGGSLNLPGELIGRPWLVDRIESATAVDAFK